MKRQLDQGFEILLKSLEVIGKVSGDRLDPKKDNTKSDHPSTFTESLREQEQQEKGLRGK